VSAKKKMMRAEMITPMDRMISLRMWKYAAWMLMLLKSYFLAFYLYEARRSSSERFSSCCSDLVDWVISSRIGYFSFSAE
jgi:hypothetical protein